MPNSRHNRVYEFEDFRLDAAHLLLYQNGRQISLAPKVVETLLALVERHGEVLSKDELMEIVWTDSIVEEGNLSQNLYLLRKVLGAGKNRKPLIETLHRRGYRFNGDVLCVEPKTAKSSLSNNNQSAAPKISTDNHHYTVERQGNVLTLTDWKTNERSEPENGDSRSQISEPANAFQACQLSRVHYHQLTPPDLIKSRALLREAVRLDAAYAPAYAALAEQSVTEAIVGLRSPAECFVKAREAIARAAELNANSAEFFAAAGYVALVCDWNFAEAERNLSKSLELNSYCASANNYLGQVFMFQRRCDKAETCLLRAREIEPAGLYHRSTLTIAYFLARNYQKVIEESENTLAVYPQFLAAAQMRCWAWEQTGKAAEAVAEYEKILAAPHGEFARRWIGYAYALVGDEENARKIAAELIAESAEHYVSPFHLATIYAGLDEADEACFYLESGLAQRDPWMLWIAADARFDNLRSNLRFQKLEKSVASRFAEANRAARDWKRAEKTESKIRVAEGNDDGKIQTTGNLSPIVGREKEIAHIKNLLSQDDVRLVTMAGVGGTGKTRLAQAVAREMARDFSDGVFFVELAAITNPELVASTIAQPLGVKEAGGKPILEMLKDYLRDKQTLIIVDNFEQVVEAAPQIGELLSAADNLKILITSRELLHLSAEREFFVPPLSLPTDALQVSPAELSKYEAIELFIERAKEAKAGFDLTNENAQSVAEICVRLDGLPLAIELAAARIKILSPKTILSKLENRLKLLTGGARDLPARRQTMRGAVEWSYDLLTEDEKCLFRRLAVFAGGFTFEAAEAVCANCDPDKECLEILDPFTSLADKSLLVSKEQEGGEMRFRMLEVVREYALESLEKNNEAEAVRRSHAAYFLALGEEAEPHLQAAKAAEWLSRLEEEHYNLRAALRWSIECDAVIAARLGAAIRNFWIFHNHLTEGRWWLESILERSVNSSLSTRFKLLNCLGALARFQGDFATARIIHEKGLEEGKVADNKQQIAYSMGGLGAVAFERSDFTAARKFIEEGLAVSRELNDKSGVGVALNFLGCLSMAEGNDATARRPLFEEAVVIFRQIGNKQAIAASLHNLGSATCAEGDYKATRAHFAEGLDLAQQLGHKILISLFLDGYAALFVRDDSARAAKLTAAAECLRESTGFVKGPAEGKFRDAYLAELKIKMDESEFTKLYEQGRKLKLEEAVALCLGEKDWETKMLNIRDNQKRKNH